MAELVAEAWPDEIAGPWKRKAELPERRSHRRGACAVHADDEPLRTVSEVYTCLGCTPECGRCARTIRRIIGDALGGCGASCVHRQSQAFPELEVFPELLEEETA